MISGHNYDSNIPRLIFGNFYKKYKVVYFQILTVSQATFINKYEDKRKPGFLTRVVCFYISPASAAILISHLVLTVTHEYASSTAVTFRRLSTHPIQQSIAPNM